MNKNSMIVIFVLVFMSSFFLRPVMAENAKPEPVAPTAAPAVQDAAAPEDETEFSFGTVKNVTDNQLVVSEYDYESNADVDVTYEVSAKTEFENAASLKEVKTGDSVDVDYLVKDGKKNAVTITVEKPLAEGEETALEPEPAAAEAKE